MSTVLSPALRAKSESLCAHLRDVEPLAIAFSGGVDSAFLLAAAQRAGVRLRALIAVSPSLARRSLERARSVAAKLGVPLEEVATREMEVAAYVANDVDRCYHCKTELFSVFRAHLAVPTASGITNWRLVDGTQADDRHDWRPGRRAAREAGVASPLLELGWGKEEIRAVSRFWDLETADLPAAPCLSSRVPTGFPVQEAALRRIEAAEEVLADLGFREIRVRDHGELARLELPVSEFPALVAQREEVVAAVAACGYREVTLDLRGYRPAGSRRGPEAVGSGGIRVLGAADEGEGNDGPGR